MSFQTSLNLSTYLVCTYKWRDERAFDDDAFGFVSQTNVRVKLTKKGKKGEKQMGKWKVVIK